MRGYRNLQPTRKVTVRLFARDVDLLRQYYPRLGYNEVVRTLVNNAVKTLERRTREEHPKLFDLDYDAIVDDTDRETENVQ